jgi:polyribonucleotide 5'-hydroxyl-kinase
MFMNPAAKPHSIETILKTRTIDVRAGTELRLVVPDEETVTLRAHSKIPDTFATAEIFGQELVLGQEYKLEGGTQIALFSHHGCTVELVGNTVQEYDATNSTMREYVNSACVLESKRIRAEETNTPAPRVLVLGSEGSGVSTFCQFLVNYSLRKLRTPIFIELDPRGASSSRQLVSLPGTVNALVVDHSAYEFGKEPIAPNKMIKPTPGAPIDMNYLSHPAGKGVYFFTGFYDWRDSPEIYKKAVAQLSCIMEAKMEISAEQATAKNNPSRSGMIISGPQNPSMELVKEIIQWYGVDTVFVLDNEPMLGEIRRMFDLKMEKIDESSIDSIMNGQIQLESQQTILAKLNKIDCLGLARCGGVIPVSQKRMQWLRNQKIKDYFCGVDRDLNPHSFAVHWNDIQVLSIIAKDPMVEQGSSFFDRFQVVPFTDSPIALKNSLLSVAISASVEDVVVSAMAGLIWIREIIEGDDGIIVHLLSPSPAPLASPFLVVGDLRNFKYFEL